MPNIFVQAKAPGVGSVPMNFGKLESGFFRFASDPEGKIYFGYPHGKWTFVFPVNSEGKICRKGGNETPYPGQKIIALKRGEWAAAGIIDIQWTDDCPCN